MSDLEKGIALSETIHKICVGNNIEIIMRALTTNMAVCFEQILEDDPDSYDATINSLLSNIGRMALVLRGEKAKRDE